MKDCKMLRKLYDNQIEISDQYRNEVIQLKKDLEHSEKQKGRWYDKFQEQKIITKELKEMLAEEKERIKELENIKNPQLIITALICETCKTTNSTNTMSCKKCGNKL